MVTATLLVLIVVLRFIIPETLRPAPGNLGPCRHWRRSTRAPRLPIGQAAKRRKHVACVSAPRRRRRARLCVTAVLPPGVGKSHLAIALGIKACEQGVRTLFITATALITTLGKALAEGKLDERLKLLTQAQLLICDELGYLPIDRQGANPVLPAGLPPLRTRLDHRSSLVSVARSPGPHVRLSGNRAR